MRQKMADSIRFLAADMVQAANSGHPGAPMGLADIAVVLSEHMNHNPKNPEWLNRDRLVFSGGHATGLIYSLYYLWGYGLELQDLKDFRQLDSLQQNRLRLILRPDDLDYGIDAESSTHGGDGSARGWYHPQQKTYSFGLNITF